MNSVINPSKLAIVITTFLSSTSLANEATTELIIVHGRHGDIMSQITEDTEKLTVDREI